MGIGAFHVARNADATFSDREVALLKTFADQAVIAIQNTRLFNETREALEQQKASADILGVISSSVADAQPVFDKILESCKHLFGGDELDVLLVDEQGQLNIAAYIGDSHDVVAATFPAPVELTPAGRAIQERKAIHWPDLVNGENVPGVLRKMAKLIGYRSMVFAPMLKGDRGIGAIGVARSTGPFNPKELAMLQTFADQAVIAIENARLFNETREALERQTATAEVLQVISSSPGDLKPVFDQMLAKAMRLCEAQCGFIYQMEQGAMRAVAEIGVPPAFAEYRRNNLHTGGAATPADMMRATRKPAHVHDARDSEPYRNGNLNAVAGVDLGGARTVLYVPMIRNDDIVGVINVYRQEVRPFTEEQISLLENFASQAVIAIENARLFNETQEALERQTATADILKVIASSPSDLQPVFEAIAERSNRLVSGLSTTVLSIVDDTIHLSAFTRTNPQADAALTASFPRQLSTMPFGEPIRQGAIYSLPDTETEPALRDLARMRGYRSMLFVPLLRDGAADWHDRPNAG